MAYTPTNWTSSTPINTENLNKMEQGIKEASESGGAGNAENVTYDNSESGLVSTNVQGAIDELSIVTFSVVDGVLYATTLIDGVEVTKRITNFISDPVALVPTLTANDENIIGSSIFSSQTDYYLAFDGSDASYWANSNNNNSTIEYIGYCFGREITPTSVYIKALAGYGSTCTAQVQGSKDGSAWENIGDSFSHTSSTDTTIELDCNKTYSYMRVQFTLSSASDWATVATLQFYGY